MKREKKSKTEVEKKLEDEEISKKIDTKYKEKNNMTEKIRNLTSSGVPESETK